MTKPSPDLTNYIQHGGHQSAKLGIWSKIAIILISIILVALGIVFVIKARERQAQLYHGSCQQFRDKVISRVPARCIGEYQ